MKKRIGYIGLGLMGKPMARNLMEAGYPLIVHNRSRASVNELAAEGAIAATSPREVASASDIVFTNLPDSPDVEQVVLGPDGIIEGCRPGMIYVDNSSIKPATTRKIAAALEEIGVSAIDAPVSGTITYVGESGAGQVAKACNQIMVAAQMTAMAELLMLAKKSNVDPRRVIEAIRGGAAQCWTMDVKPQRLFSGQRNPGFKAYMMHKDLGIVLDTARAYGIPLPAAAVNMQLYNAMLQMGMRELDNSAVVGVYEVLANEKLVTLARIPLSLLRSLSLLRG
jgi:2-hydroxy-3-oxopropionate reductase